MKLIQIEKQFEKRFPNQKEIKLFIRNSIILLLTSLKDEESIEDENPGRRNREMELRDKIKTIL
jgi:hypothetical protein